MDLRKEDRLLGVDSLFTSSYHLESTNDIMKVPYGF